MVSQGSYLQRHTSSLILKMSQDTAMPPLPAVANMVSALPSGMCNIVSGERHAYEHIHFHMCNTVMIKCFEQITAVSAHVCGQSLQ